MSLLNELKRRNVLRVGLAWLALSWLLAAMAALLFPALGLPITEVRWLVLGLAVALVPVLALAWRQGARAPAQRIDQATVVLALGALSLSLLRQFIVPLAPPAAPAPAAPVSVAVPAPRPPADPRSVAVLPFDNLSPDAGDAYFADGLSEELLNVLARIEGLRVTSRSSSFALREDKGGAADIAGRLGVAHLVTGTVRRQGPSLRITAQLVDAREDRLLWSTSHERELRDVFALQQEIAQAIADALSDALGDRQVRVAAATTDLAAYESYLRGRQLFVQRGANLPAARELLEDAVKRDPAFADAWATLAGTWYVWRSYAEAPAGIDTLAEARRAAERALALAPGHPGALAVSARLAADSGDRVGEHALIARALDREPNNANTWLWQGLGRFEAGHIDAAHASFVQAQSLDPLSGLHLGWLGISTALRGDVAQGEALLQRAHTLGWRGPASRALFLLKLGAANGGDPSQAYLDWLHDDDGMPAAQRELARSLAPGLADASRRVAAQSALRAAASAQPQLEWVGLLQSFGLTDEALQAAQHSGGSGTQVLLMTQWYPAFASFRAHPRFAELVRRQGLMAYWQAQGPPDGCRLQGEGEAATLDCNAPPSP